MNLTHPHRDKPCKKYRRKRDLPIAIVLSPLPCPFLPFSLHFSRYIPNPWRSSRSETSESIKVSDSPRESQLLIFDCSVSLPSSLPHHLYPQPPSLSAGLGSLAESQSLKKFFFGARPLESNINQITPSSWIPSSLSLQLSVFLLLLFLHYLPLDFALAVSSSIRRLHWVVTGFLTIRRTLLVRLILVNAPRSKLATARGKGGGELDDRMMWTPALWILVNNACRNFLWQLVLSAFCAKEDHTVVYPSGEFCRPTTDDVVVRYPASIRYAWCKRELRWSHYYRKARISRSHTGITERKIGRFTDAIDVYFFMWKCCEISKEHPEINWDTEKKAINQYNTGISIIYCIMKTWVPMFNKLHNPAFVICLLIIKKFHFNWWGN